MKVRSLSELKTLRKAIAEQAAHLAAETLYIRGKKIDDFDTSLEHLSL